MPDVPPSSSNAHRVTNHAANEIIAEEGSTSLGWYVLLSGRVGVFKRDTKIAEFATRGMVFGELSSILHQPRTARLVALEPTTAMHFDADLDQLVKEHPQVAKTMLVSLAQRLATTTDALWSALGDQKRT